MTPLNYPSPLHPDFAMPGTTKRVHFDIPPTPPPKHFEVPPTPSPVHSDVSLPSSVGIITPPQLAYAQLSPKYPLQYVPGSPSSFGSLPYVAGHVMIHPVLAAPRTALAWDLILPPSAANVPTTYGSPSPLNPALLAEPATHPGLPSLTIICDMLPWSITITPSRTHFVSVGDVLHALYRMLRLAVTETEVGVLPPDTRVRVHSAFHARHKMLPDARSRAEEKQKGVKRVDFLMDLRRFAGLSIVMSGAALNGKGLGEVWALQLAMA
ncbi:uncharacterized protein C8Q71DRAFT_760742 [Rhodofomes roseus]|uniref:DUF6699 domain-containing protein n=1 Tax=Rhodofomes roseus TaxID=34475 RepID=A0ABQ8KEF7_9APHY|nr:uncharacterized protein C8Q71DRAFT_760742 [Rhodofomes roseus]KAH9836128.1 hypothetical protein C8Q71DRAFT_760742 [Rhodofomes roseus]